eukprot:gene10679-11635_t
MSDQDYGIDEAKADSLKSPVRILAGPSDTITSEDSLEQKISLRMEIALKKEKLRLEEEANYTYKPKLYTNGRSKPQTPTAAASTPTAADRENRFDKLYSDALQRHITQNTKEEQKDRDLTFTPKITKRASSATRSGSASRSNSRSASRERGNDAPSDGRQTPRANARKSLEPEKPSFQPAITKRAKSIERARDKEVSERLYEHGLHVKEKMDRKRVEAEQKELETCTFVPKVDSKRSSSASRLNVVERMGKFEEARQKKLQEAVDQKKETEKSFSFQPTLLSKRPTTPTQQPFYERLAIPHEKPVSHAAIEAMSQLTFHPQIVSKRTPSPNTTRQSFGEFKSVHERLYREGEERRREVENELQNRRHELDSELTFHPQIITPTPQQHEPVFERLSVGADRNEVKQKLDRIKAELTKDWTFQPAISEMSKKLLGPRRETESSVYDRQVAEQRRLEEELIRKKQEQEDEQLREATFAPKLPESSKELAKKKLSTNSMDVTSTDVYSRLASALSPTGTVQENSFTSTGVINPVAPTTTSRSIILPEKTLNQVFARLATPSVQQFEEYTRDAEGKKVVLPEKEREQVFTRLTEKKTKSFTLKTHESENRISANPSPSGKNAFSEEAFLQKVEEGKTPTSKQPPQSPNKKLTHKDSHLSAVSSITAGSAKETPVKKTRAASASKLNTPTTTPASKTTRAPVASTAKKSAVKPASSNLPSPPVVKRDKLSAASPMPPAPPATAVKGNQPSNAQTDYYDDLAKKLEASLTLINENNGLTSPPPAPATVEKSTNGKTAATTATPNKAKKYAITDSPLPKESEDFINSIPVVHDPNNGELSD